MNAPTAQTPRASQTSKQFTLIDGKGQGEYVDHDDNKNSKQKEQQTTATATHTTATAAARLSLTKREKGNMSRLYVQICSCVNEKLRK
jgi:hypothetical protein